MNLIKQKNLVLAFTILCVSSCQTSQNEIKEPEVNKIIISEDKIFEEYLASQWDKDLEDSPIFASPPVIVELFALHGAATLEPALIPPITWYAKTGLDVSTYIFRDWFIDGSSSEDKLGS